ncbi:MAG: hypothetical protein IT292_00955 [Deltaproteobacteria bacterium]|nr:hypothetical protein [Deltaproteobacteria bacterium]
MKLMYLAVNIVVFLSLCGVTKADLWECFDIVQKRTTITENPTTSVDRKCSPYSLGHVPYNKISSEEFAGFINGIKEEKDKLIFEQIQKGVMSNKDFNNKRN